MAKIGIIGSGWGARVQVPAFEEAGHVIAGVAGRANWRTLLDDPSVDLVTIVMPPSRHLEMARAALEAGKHVLCEKPTAMNVAEAEAPVAAARAHPKQLALIDHELRFLPAWRAARERIHDLGELFYAEVRYASPGRADRTREWTWWSDANEGGGIWGAVGSHFIDTLHYLGLEFEAVQAMLATRIATRSGRAVTSDDFASVHARLTNGVVAVMTFAVVAGVDEPTTLTIHGEHGAMRLMGEELLFAKRGSGFERVAGNEIAKRPGNSAGGAFGTGTLLLGKALKKAIDDGDATALAPAATFEDGLKQQRVLDAARASDANEGRFEKVLGRS